MILLHEGIYLWLVINSSIPVAVPSKVALSLGFRVRIPPVGIVNIVCCEVEVSAADRLLVQRTPNKCGVSESDLETSTAPSGPLVGLDPLGAVEPWEKDMLVIQTNS
jgi:hypothetical protein